MKDQFKNSDVYDIEASGDIFKVLVNQFLIFKVLVNHFLDIEKAHEFNRKTMTEKIEVLRDIAIEISYLNK